MLQLLAGGGIVVGAFAFWLLAVWPPPSWYRTHWPAETAFMVMRESTGFAGRRLAGSSAKSGRLDGRPARRYHPVPLDSIAPYMQDAVMIGEDNNFLTHSGIDYLALAHALGYRRESFSWRDARERQELLALLPGAWSKRDRLRGRAPSPSSWLRISTSPHRGTRCGSSRRPSSPGGSSRPSESDGSWSCT